MLLKKLDLTKFFLFDILVLNLKLHLKNENSFTRFQTKKYIYINKH